MARLHSIRGSWTAEIELALDRSDVMLALLAVSL
jgi:hypothetical protein